MIAVADAAEWQRRFRFLVNGLLATAVHFGALVIAIEVLALPSAGLANLLAASVGIVVSFMGNRWFVFCKHDACFVNQARRFAVLYGAIALAHGVVLWAWADMAGLDYRLGFVIATAGQIVLSYFGNMRLVFR